MTSVKLKLHKNKLLKDGTYPLVFQIIHNRRKKVLYTNYKIRESDFLSLIHISEPTRP